MGHSRPYLSSYTTRPAYFITDGPSGTPEQLTTRRLMSSRTTHRVHRLVFGIGQRPISRRVRDERALVTAPHRDEQRAATRKIRGEPLGPVSRHVDPGFLHHVHHHRVRGRRAACRPRWRALCRVGEGIEPGGRHLRPSRVMDAREDDLSIKRPLTGLGPVGNQPAEQRGGRTRAEHLGDDEPGACPPGGCRRTCPSTRAPASPPGSQTTSTR